MTAGLSGPEATSHENATFLGTASGQDENETFATKATVSEGRNKFLESWGIVTVGDASAAANKVKVELCAEAPK